MRPPFEVIDYYAEVISGLSSDGYDFAKMWVAYLNSCGWDEESYEQELQKRLFSEQN